MVSETSLGSLLEVTPFGILATTLLCLIDRDTGPMDLSKQPMEESMEGKPTMSSDTHARGGRERNSKLHLGRRAENVERCAKSKWPVRSLRRDCA